MEEGAHGSDQEWAAEVQILRFLRPKHTDKVATNLIRSAVRAEKVMETLWGG